METILACSLISLSKQDSKDNEETNPISPTTTWDAMKKGSIVGAAALTGGALMALTGGTETLTLWCSNNTYFKTSN